MYDDNENAQRTIAVRDYLIDNFHLPAVDALVIAETVVTDPKFLKLLGFEHSYGYGHGDEGLFYPTMTEEDALWNADRKPEQHGGLVGDRWLRYDMQEREYGAYERISKLRQERLDRKLERDRRIAEIKAEYADLD